VRREEVTTIADLMAYAIVCDAKAQGGVPGGVDWRLIQHRRLEEQKARLAQYDNVIGKCPYCKNHVGLATGKRVIDAKPNGMVSVKVCERCASIVKAQTDAELKASEKNALV